MEFDEYYKCYGKIKLGKRFHNYITKINVNIYFMQFQNSQLDHLKETTTKKTYI